MRTFLVAILLALVAGPAPAMNTWGTDMSDLWWNPDESGWGINIAHQRDTIFATIFVYGADNRARWYVAPAMVAPDPNVTPTTVTYAFSGKLYETQGPALGGAFDPAAVTNREVGTASINFYEVGKGTLTYGVDNTAVTREIRRQTFKLNDIAGTYLGGSVATEFNPCSFGQATLVGSGDVTFTYNAESRVATIVAPAVLNQRCTITGIYEQQGRMGTIDGSYSCTAGLPGGRFVAFEIEAGYNAISLRYVAEYGNCVERGRMAGVRR